MTFLTVQNWIVYSFGAIVCAYIAKKKGFNTRIALFFGIFATICYAFKKSNVNGWTIKDSWTYLGIHLGLIIGWAIDSIIFE